MWHETICEVEPEQVVLVRLAPVKPRKDRILERHKRQITPTAQIYSQPLFALAMEFKLMRSFPSQIGIAETEEISDQSRTAEVVAPPSC